jgi:hypothetical protein
MYIILFDDLNFLMNFLSNPDYAEYHESVKFIIDSVADKQQIMYTYADCLNLFERNTVHILKDLLKDSAADRKVQIFSAFEFILQTIMDERKSVLTNEKYFGGIIFDESIPDTVIQSFFIKTK